MASFGNSNDAGDILKPGIYLLTLHGRVVYIGRAKCMLAAIADHRSAVGQKLPIWFPIRGVAFDGIRIIPMPYSESKDLAQALVDRYRPSHNIHVDGEFVPEPVLSTRPPAKAMISRRA